MKIKSKKARIWIYAAAAVLLLIVTPVLLIIRPAELDRNDIEISDDDVDNLSAAAARIATELTKKENGKKQLIRVKFSEAEKLSMLKMFSKTARKELAPRGITGFLDSRHNHLIWQMEQELAVGVLPVKAEFLLVVSNRKINIYFTELYIGLIPVPSAYLPAISRQATEKINSDKSAAQLAVLLHEAKFNTDGTMEIVIDRYAAMYLVVNLIPR